MRRRRGLHPTHWLGVASLLALLGNQPCGPIPGDALEGRVRTEPVTDWAFSDAHRSCRIEVRPEAPHSVTTYCAAGDDGALYVPAIMGENKRWTKFAVENPNARVKIGEEVFPVTLERIEDPEERLATARRIYRKYHGKEPDADWAPSDDRWYFRATSRASDPGS